MEEGISIGSIKNDVTIYGSILLDILLKDRTTGKNIICATNDYLMYGYMYSANMEIKLDLITGKYSKIIQPRITKAKEHQSNRTREKAEVFTPLWICNEQNNLIDEQWFGRKFIFNKPLNCSWSVVKENILYYNSIIFSYNNCNSRCVYC